MNRIGILALLVVSLIGLGWHGAASAQKDLAAELPSVPPKEPKEALTSFTLAPGFRIELVACEPLVASPVAIDFDEDGRLYVAEFPEYNLHDDPGFVETGRVKRLVDTDGDGVYDTATVFASDLPAPTAVACWNGGVLVSSVPNLLEFHDTNNDGRADVRQVILTGFDRDKAGEGMLNSIRWSLDNRFVFSTSLAGGMVRPGDRPTAESVAVRGRFISIDPRTRRFETISGHGQHGMSMDDWGRTFVCDNSNPIHHIVYDGRYALRNPFAAAPAVAVNIHEQATEPKLQRTSSFEPWRVARTRLRMAGLAKGPTEGGRIGGHFTGTTGVTFYRGDAFPPECRQHAFIGEVSNNLVHRVTVSSKGLGFSAKRTDVGREFLASSDNWFRPCQFANGPDGCLYVVDMYRELIETVLSIPPDILKHLHPRSGVERGRIWRIVPVGHERRPQPKLSQATTAELVAFLDHANGWHRDTASRLLYQRQDRTAVPLLQKSVREASTPQGRVHSLLALAGLDALSPAIVLEAMGDGDPRVREQALRLSEQFADRPEISGKWTAMASDADPRVRWQLAFSAGASPSKAITETLVRLAMADDDPLMRFAILSSSRDRAGALLASLLRDTPTTSRSKVTRLLIDLAASIGQSRRDDDIASLLQATETLGDSPLKRDLITSMLAKLPAGIRDRLQSQSVRDVLHAMLADSRRIVLDPKRPLVERSTAASNLRLGAFADVRPLYGELLRPNQPESIQKAAIVALGSADDREAAEILLGAWPGLSPGVRAVATEALLARPAWVDRLFDRIEAGVIQSSEIDPARIALLRRDDATRARADKLFAHLSKRGDVLAKYKSAMENSGDVSRGRGVFRRHCTACHRREGVGEAIGADLAGIQDRGAEFLLVNILDPNREVLPKFLAYRAETDSGRSVTGMIQSETATSLTVRRLDGTSETIPRSQLESLRGLGLSFMPEGFENQITVAEMADLIAYLLATP